MTNEEYDIREAFADKYITGWKGRVRVGNVNIPYCKDNAHCMAYHMSREEFEAAVANPKALMRKLKPPLITWEKVVDFSLEIGEYGLFIIASTLLGLGVLYLTQSMTAAVMVTYVCAFSSAMTISTRRMFEHKLTRW